MKKLFWFGFVAIAGVAHAQSSVVLYGIVDAGFTYNSNAKGAPTYALTSGTEGAGRWGVTGKEDLGAGLSAVFTLENGYSATTGALGQNGTFFGRQAFVGLSSTQIGTATLGRQYASSSIYLGAFSSGGDWAAAGSTFGTHPGDLDNLDSTNRVDNAIKYQSIDYRGFSVGGLYSLGGKAGDFSQNQIWSLAGGYSGGGLSLAVGILNARNPNFSLWGNKANDSLTGSNITSPVASGYASAHSQQVIGIGGAYVFSSLRVAAVLTNSRFTDIGGTPVAGAATTLHGDANFTTGELNLKYTLTPTILLGAAYHYTRGSGVGSIGSSHYQQANLGADYMLSKRTDLYALFFRQFASGTDSTGHAAVAAISGASPSSSNTQTLVSVGIRHRF